MLPGDAGLADCLSACLARISGASRLAEEGLGLARRAGGNESVCERNCRSRTRACAGSVACELCGSGTGAVRQGDMADRMSRCLRVRIPCGTFRPEHPAARGRVHIRTQRTAASPGRAQDALSAFLLTQRLVRSRWSAPKQRSLDGPAKRRERLTARSEDERRGQCGMACSAGPFRPALHSLVLLAGILLIARPVATQFTATFKVCRMGALLSLWTAQKRLGFLMRAEFGRFAHVRSSEWQPV
jgi:hypothetical protein